MVIYYLYNSGIVCVTSENILVFDYWKDPSGILSQLLSSRGNRKVTFFVSHSHYDHFNPEIFSLKDAEEFRYVLSYDIPQNDIPIGISFFNVNPGDEAEANGNRIKVFGSTDKGVSFFVEDSSATTIFHAGDLNYWHWELESSPEEIEKALRDYESILNDIAENVKETDVMFFPVDRRLGANIDSGAMMFINRIPTRFMIPIHIHPEARIKTLPQTLTGGKSETGMLPTQYIVLQHPGDKVELPLN